MALRISVFLPYIVKMAVSYLQERGGGLSATTDSNAE